MPNDMTPEDLDRVVETVEAVKAIDLDALRRTVETINEMVGGVVDAVEAIEAIDLEELRRTVETINEMGLDRITGAVDAIEAIDLEERLNA